MTGQTVAALLLDHFGLLGNPKSPASFTRIVGTLLLVAGVFAIVHAKTMEEPHKAEPSSPQVSDTDEPTGQQKNS